MEAFSGSEVRSSPAAAFSPQPIRFTGRGAEYFGIWIVNLLLTILTVGIYSAWAKVRRLQYFYRHTELAGSTFDFHGTPGRILIGRVLALVLLGLYQYSVRLHSVMTLVIIVALAAVMPWLLRNSFRFWLYNSSWRGTRFHFRGSLAGAYRVFLLNGFLAIITLYILAPFMHHRLKQYQHGNTWFGKTQFSFTARAGQFYLIYLMLLAALIAFGILVAASGVTTVFAAIAAQKQGGHVDPRALMRVLIVIYASLIILSLLIGPLFQSMMTNLIWNNTRLGEHRIECRMSPWPLMWLGVSNLFMIVITLGLFYPWAIVRLTRYRLQCIQIHPATDLQEFEDSGPERVGAVGEEAATVFDFDIAL